MNQITFYCQNILKEVSLYKIIQKLSVLLLILFSCRASGQIIEANFDVQTNACLDEQVRLTNTSQNATQYKWNFCIGDFSRPPTITKDVSSGTLSGFGMKIVKHDELYYGFSIEKNRLYRLEFGNNLNNQSVATDLGNLNVLTNAEAIDIVKQGDKWIGFTGFGASGNGGEVIRIVWDDLAEVPTGESLGNFGVGNRIRGLTVVQEGDKNILLMTFYNGKLSRVDFQDSFLNAPQPEDIYTSNVLENVQFPVALSVFKNGVEWNFVVGSLITKNLSLFTLGSDLLSEPQHVKTQQFDTYAFIAKLKVIREGLNFYTLVSTFNKELHLIDLKQLQASDIFEEIIIADMPIVYGIDIVKEDSKHYVFGVRSKLQRLIFENQCPVIQDFSKEQSPQITYSQPGTYEIDLAVSDANSDDYLTKIITISNSDAPHITYSSQNICLSTPINFTSSTDQPISVYSWDFGDTNTSPDPNPSHTYSTAGEYEVTLDVESTNGCHNFIKQTIIIYDEPIPDFTLPSGSICTNEDYTFVNSTLDNFDGNLTYEWQVDEKIVSVDRELVYQFATDDAKEIKLITSISGCSIEQVQNIANVNLGAAPSYSYDANNACLDDPITFTNQSTGTEITSYVWDFGDTSGSVDTNPTYSYGAAGTYMVTLQVTNSAGCITSYEDEVTVHSLPITDFSSDLACTEGTTQLSDLSTVDNSNISSWDWNFGDTASGAENVSSDEDPLHTFSDLGDFVVTLSTTTNFGCESSIQKTIQVLESPVVDFDFSVECVGKAFRFSDASVPNMGGSIISRTWDIDGSVYTVQNPSHTFSSAGTFDAILTIQSNNLCSISTAKTITVNQLPTVDFSLSSNCANTEVSIEDESILINDNIVNWQWTVNGKDAGNSSKIMYTFEEAMTQQIELRIITERGCIVSTSKDIEFFGLPVADFQPSLEYSASPAVIDFENNSKNAVSYLWNFGDGSIDSSEKSPSHTFTDLDTYDVSLTVYSSEGCTSEQIKKVDVVIPEIDLAIGEITTFNNGENVLFTMSNYGTLPVTSVTATVTINNEISIKEIFDLTILPDQTVVPKTLSFAIPDGGQIDFMCIELSTGIGSDINPQNNTQCINIEGNFQILDPYPNPASREGLVTISWIGEKNDGVIIRLINTNGKQLISKELTLTQGGLNNVDFSLFSLKPGIYFIEVQSATTIKSIRIFVN